MSQKQQWSSRLGFVLAAAGSAIGLGAIWKFPYVAGMSGGGAFLVLFILFTLLIGLPLLLGEFIIGRSTQEEAVTAYQTITPSSGWHWIGRLGIFTCFILLSFYSVIGGWILLYLFNTLTGQLMDNSANYAMAFQNIIAQPIATVGAQFVFIILTILVVSRGVQNGIEKANKYLMPALFILFLILIIRSLTLEGASEGLAFFLQPDFTNITSQGILYAMGQSFFALSVGVSVMVTYSSYLGKQENLPQSAGSIVGLNIIISLLAGLAIFPAVFSIGVEPAKGPGLLFIALPSVFAKVPLGTLFLIAFLALFLFATLTSAFSMLEVIVASLTKKQDHKRTTLTWIVGLAIFIVGIPSTLSYGVLSDVTILDKSIFDAADFLVSNILMPLGALLIAIFVPLKIKRETLWQEFTAGLTYGRRLFALWLFLIRYLAPIAIIIVFLDVLNII
ncbi:sodium-dependent transporter [Tuberibacillus sp. Marseille-P3662]|uniref:sodium-dependent transporter n=1 Tax=Tuberibacillus sp. Marseille-P3662 TaxID=1965358 RepID=UPI000A1CCAD9|nr:sodium-dependent transporter [Tuberibacillus sp. Marseille-P3662]